MIIADDGHRCQAGEPGQIYFRSLLGSDFEYHKAPEKTAAAHLEPGVGTLGDVGYLDDDGYLFLSDRKIDMIISGGVNIYPAEIEAVLSTTRPSPTLRYSVSPMRRWASRSRPPWSWSMALGPPTSWPLSSLTIRDEHLAGYKAPKTVDFAECLPRQPTGKLYKRLLRDPYWEDSGRQI